MRPDASLDEPDPSESLTIDEVNTIRLQLGHEEGRAIR